MALGVKDEHPYYSGVLLQMSERLFVKDVCGIFLNQIAFGDIACLIQKEPVSVDFGTEVHPYIKELSNELYCDRHFVPAAKEAVEMVAACFHDKCRELNPKSEVPSSMAGVITSILGEDGLF